MNVYIHKVKSVLDAGPVGYAEIQAQLGLNRLQVRHAIGELSKQGFCKRLPAIKRKRQYIGAVS